MNLFENSTTVQFTHRLIAVATFLAILALWLGAQRITMTRPRRLWLHAVGAAAVIQVALGISTLVLRVPVPLAYESRFRISS